MEKAFVWYGMQFTGIHFLYKVVLSYCDQGAHWNFLPKLFTAAAISDVLL